MGQIWGIVEIHSLSHVASNVLVKYILRQRRKNSIVKLSARSYGTGRWYLFTKCLSNLFVCAYASKLHIQMSQDVCVYGVWLWWLVHDTQDKWYQFLLTSNNSLVFGQIFGLTINITFLNLIPPSHVLRIITSFTINVGHCSGANAQRFPFIFYLYQSWYLFFFLVQICTIIY